jgi:hypothetical protein
MRLIPTLLACLAFGCGVARAQAPAQPLHEAVLAYGVFQEDVTALSRAEIDSAAALDDVMERAARHEPRALSRGWIAYGALIAAQSPAFAAGVQSRVRAASRAAVLRRLAADRAYARNRPPGSAEAVRLILEAMAADGARLGAAAERYQSVADTMQLSAWAVAPTPGRVDRDARLRALSGQTPNAPASLAAVLRIAPLAANPLADPYVFGGPRFWDAWRLPFPRPTSRPETSGLQTASAGQDAIDRMLTLGALHILGASGTPTQPILRASAPPPHIDALLADESAERCLTMAQLQFRQCVSVTQFPYESAYCLARHGLSEPGQCVASVARAPA